MRKIVVLSTNNNPDYYFYTPIVEWVWNKYGWEVALFVTSDCKDVKVNNPNTMVFTIPDIEGVRTGTLAQTVRHFAANWLPEDALIMVNDIDLIPLNNVWNPDPSKKTVWGWELTGRSFIPVHYTTMMGSEWKRIMDCTGDMKADMEREMKANGRAYGQKWEEYWDTDWDILTQKVQRYINEFTFVDRGFVRLAKDPLPTGRVDRYDMEATIKQPNWIDCHAENHNPSAPHKWDRLRSVLTTAHGDLPEWIEDHVHDHHQKHGQGR